MTITMRSLVFSAAVAGALTLGVSRPSEAALFLKIDTSAASVSCDNSTAAGVTACSANGFATSLDSNLISFTGSVGGYDLTGLNVGVTGAGSSLALNSQFDAVRNSGGNKLELSFAAYNFALPVGSLNLSTSQNASWTTGAVSSSTFETWAQSDNLPPIPNGNATVSAPKLSSDDPVSSFSAQSTEVPFTQLVTPFALTAVETIHQAIGDKGSYSGTVSATADGASGAALSPQAVPEPSSMVLLGTGVLGLVYWRRRRS